MTDIEPGWLQRQINSTANNQCALCGSMRTQTEQPNEKPLHIITKTGCSICGTDALHCSFWKTYRNPERESGLEDKLCQAVGFIQALLRQEEFSAFFKQHVERVLAEIDWPPNNEIEGGNS